MSNRLLDSRGNPIQLGPRLGKGGEGAVFPLAKDPSRVAKLYHDPIKPEKAAKLEIMPSLRNDEILSLTAWPLDIIYDETRRVRGFVMPNIAGHKDIHYLYSPKSRRSEFPDADFRFILHVASNVARAFATIHNHGTVIGDVNHGGITVSAKATVKLIDCDSFQITNGSKRFLCEVGVPTFTAPELQGKSFRGVVRTANHDNFGLAVLLFHLLYMGRHPFAGKPLTRDDISIQTAITQCWFPYSGDRARTRMDQPPNTLRLVQMTDEVANLFLRAFRPESVRDGARPSAAEWVGALERLKAGLRQCSRNQTHHYPGSAQSCPWCDLESKIGVMLFGLGSAAAAGFDVRAALARIMAVQPPQQLPFPDAASLQPVSGLSLSARAIKSAQVGQRLLAVASAAGALAAAGMLEGSAAGWSLFGLLALAFVLFRSSRNERARQKLEEKRGQIAMRFDDLRKKWNATASDALFRERREWLRQQGSDLENISGFRQSLMADLDARRREVQFRRHLASANIEDGKVPGIGPSRAATLASFNIETALDITERAILGVPGFGKKRAADLMAWRRKVERAFVYHPNQPHNPADIAEVDRKVAQRRAELQKILLAGPSELERLKAQVVGAREQLAPDAAAVARELTQADYDIASFS